MRTNGKNIGREVKRRKCKLKRKGKWKRESKEIKGEVNKGNKTDIEVKEMKRKRRGVKRKMRKRNESGEKRNKTDRDVNGQMKWEKQQS